jgi:HlyD family secretion protein/epimerase transport system membrane fusion protein
MMNPVHTGYANSQQLLDPNGLRVVNAATLRNSLRRPERLGLVVMILFGIGFIGWGGFVPLAGGAIAPGVISPDGDRKTVQHLEGGIIAQLLVRDGDVVSAGQPLVFLESIQPKATHDMLVSQQWTLLVTHVRLVAEQAGNTELQFSPAMLATTDERLRAMVDGQRRLFNDRLATHMARKNVLRQRIEQLNEQIIGLRAQVDSSNTQLELIAEELVGKEALLRRAIVTKPEVLKLQRAVAELEGRRGEYLGAIARAQQQIGETQIQILMTDAERVDQVTTRLEQLRVELATVTEKLNSSVDILKRTVIAAPIAGVVLNMRFKTHGGVLKPAEPILDIVPADDTLLIDARISPIDIDVVRAGLPAKVQLTAYSGRSTPRLNGIVRMVSADRLMDEGSRQPYYLARVHVDREEVRQAQADMELIPGMPAEVLIVTGERTMAEYLLQPFLDALWRSFRET